MPLIGDPIRLTLQLFDGAPDKFVRAYLFNELGIPLSPPFVSLTHVGNGLYIDNSVPFPINTLQVKASYTVFNDALFTQVSRKHSDAIDVFDLESQFIIVNRETLIGTLYDGSLVGSFVDTESLSGELIGGTLAGAFDGVATYVGELLESSDDIIPGSNNDDGLIQGDVLC